MDFNEFSSRTDGSRIFHDFSLRWEVTNPGLFLHDFPTRNQHPKRPRSLRMSIAEGPRICGMVFFDVNFAGFC